MKQSESVKGHKHVTKSPRRVKEQKSAKENVKSQKNVVKVASVCKKVERDHKKKTHLAQHEKQDMLRKPKKLDENDRISGMLLVWASEIKEFRSTKHL